MKAEDWTGNLIGLLIVFAVALIFITSSVKDVYSSWRTGEIKPGMVSAIGKQDPACRMKCAYQSWITFEDGMQRIAYFKLTEGSRYDFVVLPPRNEIISANTWNPFGNKPFGLLLGAIFFALTLKEFVVLRRRFESMHT